MRFYIQQAVRALIILLFALFIIKLHYSGDILKLINPKYATLSKIGVVILLVLFTAQLQRVWAPAKNTHSDDHGHDCHHHDHGYSAVNVKKLLSYAIIILPLFTGIFFPLTTLDASIANKKGVMLSITNNAMNQQNNQQANPPDKKEESVEKPEQIEVVEEKTPDIPEQDSQSNESVESNIQVDPNERDPNVDANKISKEEYQSIIANLKNQSTITMSDKLFSTYYEEMSIDLDAFEGKEIKLNGFIYKEDGFKNNQLVIGRFLVTHCVADASIIGFLSEFDAAATIEQDTWLEATGTIVIQEYNGVQLPTIKVSEWKTIEEPKQPYLYPLTTKVL